MTVASKRRRFVQNDVVLSKTTSFCYLFKKKKKRNDVILSPPETKRRRFTMPPAQKQLPLLVVLVCSDRGGGGRKTGPPAARWDQRSHMMSEIAATAGDGGFGPTSERGNDGLWTANRDGDSATATLRRQRPRLAFLLISSLLRIVSCDFPQIYKIAVWKSFPFFLLFIEIFVSVVGSSKWFTGVHILSGNLCFGECQFAFLVQFFG